MAFSQENFSFCLSRIVGELGRSLNGEKKTRTEKKKKNAESWKNKYHQKAAPKRFIF